MRKHIIGFTLFTFIVVSAAIIYAIIYPFKEVHEKNVTACRFNRSEEPRPPVLVQASRLKYELKNFFVDLEKGTGTAELKLEWMPDMETPPAGLRFDLGVATAEKPLHGIQLGSCYLDEPFAYGRTVTKTCEFKLWGATLDPKVKNYYGYAEVADRDDGGSTKLVQIEKNRMIGAVPALVKHPKKK